MTNIIRRLLRCIIIIFLLIIKTSQPVKAQTPQVVINEFLIDPQPQQVELLNTGPEPIDISNWYIDDNGGSTYFTVPQGSVLYPNACVSFSYDYNLNKSSADTIRLYDKSAPPTSPQSFLNDSFSYKSSYGSGISYFRLPDGSNIWATGSATIGLYNESKLSCIITATQSPTPTIPNPTPTVIRESSPTISQATPTAVQTYENIYISEVMVYPVTGEHEWIELYNGNDFSVTLDDWYIDDAENSGSTPRMFSTNISAKSYQTIDLSSSIFNNDFDQVRLLDHLKLLKDSFEYSNAIQSKTFGRTDFYTENFCIQVPSKNIPNTVCLILSPQPTKTGKLTLSPVGQISPAKISPMQQPQSIIRPTTTTSVLRSVPKPTDPIGTVLGTQSTTQPVSQSKHLSELFAFNSFSYSILSIFSIVVKIKKSTAI